MVGDHAVAACDTPLWSVADKDVTTVEGLGNAATAASAAARVYRRAGLAVRLLRFRHPDQRRRSVEAKPETRQTRMSGPRWIATFAAAVRITAWSGRCCARRPKWQPDDEPRPPPPPKLPVSLAANPVLSSWVRFSPEGQVTVSPGKVEIGQGIVTALAQIAADELDVDIGRVQMVRASTAASPNEGVTSGSLSVQQSGRAIRQACAEVRQIFLAVASDRLGVGIDALAVRMAPSPVPAMSGPATGNSPETFRWIVTRRRALCPSRQRSARWPEIPFSGWISPTRFSRIPVSFTISALPGMLHGRVLRSELPAAKLLEA